MELKNLMAAFFAGGLLLAPLILPGQGLAAEKVYKLSMTTLYPTTHPTAANGWLPWAETIKKETNGRVIINYFNPGTLCPANEIWSSTVSGAVDIGGQLHNASPGKFPYMSAADLPLLVESAVAGSLSAWDLYAGEAVIQDELKQVKVLWQWSSADYHVQTVSRPVHTLEDLKGMKILCWSQPVAEVAKALGANPIVIPLQDTYLSLQRGMADGLLTPIASMRSFKTSEVCKYTTMASIMTASMWMGMNWDTWNSLPEDIKAVFEKHSGRAMAEISGRTLDDGAAEDYAYLKENNAQTFYILPPEELTRWRKAVQPLREKWIADMKGKGLGAAPQVYESIVDISARNAAAAPRRY